MPGEILNSKMKNTPSIGVFPTASKPLCFSDFKSANININQK
ncbi:hypothetical protein [Tenacibaculum xiamenense]